MMSQFIEKLCWGHLKIASEGPRRPLSIHEQYGYWRDLFPELKESHVRLNFINTSDKPSAFWRPLRSGCKNVVAWSRP